MNNDKSSDIKSIVDHQRKFFRSKTTLDISYRIKILKRIKILLEKNESKLYDAIYQDFKKSEIETYMTELGSIYHEIDRACRNLKSWSKSKRVRTNILNFPAKSILVPQPLGLCLVIGSWNYPYNVSILPLISAVAAGNTVVLKPSEIACNTSSVMSTVFNDELDDPCISVIEGGVKETTLLLEQNFDKIFFTGSTKVGKIVYEKAAKNLTPVILELGGKSPAIFTPSCNLEVGVKRMVWAKFLNAGQTCIAPDYCVVHSSIKTQFLKLVKEEIIRAKYSIGNDNYVSIINKFNTERILDLLQNVEIYFGGNHNIDECYISPTIVNNVSFDHKIMDSEIFGPILPIIEYENLDIAFKEINKRPKPLAAYLFTSQKTDKNKFIKELPFGGGGINEVIMQFTNPKLPFGGVGESGFGSYHGKNGFKAFSHYKSIMDKPTFFELSLKYAPYSLKKFNIIKRLLKL